MHDSNLIQHHIRLSETWERRSIFRRRETNRLSILLLVLQAVLECLSLVFSLGSVNKMLSADFYSILVPGSDSISWINLFKTHNL